MRIKPTESRRFWGLLISVLSLSACGGGGMRSMTARPAAPSYALSGRVQKGPFATGSEITVSALNAQLNPTGTVYNTETSDAFGDFAVSSMIAASQVEIVAQGFYIDELTGELSAAQITLRAISDLGTNASPTVNILTTLQEQRLKNLVSQGSTFAAADFQSEGEVLALFGIKSLSVSSLATPDSMRVDGTADSDAVLLAISVVLSQMATDSAKANGTTEVAELSNLIDSIGAGIAASGTLASASFIPARNLAESEINAASVTNNLQAHYSKNGMTVTVPRFIEWVDESHSGILPQRLVPVAGLSYSAVTAAAPEQLTTSNTITVAGAGSGVVVPIVVSQGTTIIKNGVAIVGQYAIAEDGDTIALQVTGPGYGTNSESTISVGSSSATWNVIGQQLSGAISGLTGSGLVLQANTSDSVSVPPNGTSFAFPTQIGDGSTYSVTVLTQPSSPLQNCVVNNGTGTVGADAAHITVTCSAVELVYTQDVVGAAGSSVIKEYQLNEDTGALILFSLGGAGDLANGIGATHDGKFVYTSTSRVISNFTVDASTGALFQVGSITAGTKPAIPTIDPTNRFLYAADQVENRIWEFSIESSTGALTAIGSFTTAAPPYAIAIDPKGFFVYATTSTSILVLSIDATGGSLTQVDSISIAGNAGSVFPVVDPIDQFLYTTQSNTNSVSVYNVNDTTGNLTSFSSVATGTGPSFAVINPAGTFLYVANITSNDISEFAINSVTGALALVGTTAPGQLDAGITSLAIDPSGNYVFATFVSSDSTYRVDQVTGALTLAGSTQTGNNDFPVGSAIVVVQ
jgi:6-phosphogluconolactonase (cycloisomerase 2 family)